MAKLQSSKQLWEDPIFFSLFLLFLSLVLLFKRNRTKGKLNLPPSPPRLPIIGNLHQLGTLPYRSLQALSHKYGPLMLLNLGQLPTLVVSSAKMVREITKNHDTVFSNRPKTTASDVLAYSGKDVVFGPYGECWRQVRKICVVELLSQKRVLSLQSVREEEVANLVDCLRKSFLEGRSINLSQILSLTSNNVVSRCVLGEKCDVEKNGLTLGDLAKTLSKQLVAFSVGDFFPSFKWIDVVRGFIGSLESTFEILDSFNDRVIEEHRKIKAKGECQMKDFLDVLLQIQRDGMHDIDLTHDHLKAILLDLLAAGIDATTTASEWLMAELLRNPRVLKKAQEEVRRVVGKKAKLDINDIDNMSYLRCVVKESLRLHPPTPLLIPRETTANVQIGGYHIPAKTRVLINAWAIQRDPSTWDNPEEFFPERFENNPVDFRSQDYQLIPFGFGRRQCPGMTFGIVSTLYLISNLLYWFDWKLPDGTMPEDLDMTEVHGISVTKKASLYAVAIPYTP
ncbi:hypothetical protein UlMin_043946 [Ulmus minor]